MVPCQEDVVEDHGECKKQVVSCLDPRECFCSSMERSTTKDVLCRANVADTTFSNPCAVQQYHDTFGHMSSEF
jgi:hypothetical protein